jgi:hypothetical protein
MLRLSLNIVRRSPEQKGPSGAATPNGPENGPLVLAEPVLRLRAGTFRSSF